jgi:hypothetical protein
LDIFFEGYVKNDLLKIFFGKGTGEEYFGNSPKTFSGRLRSGIMV